MTLFPVVIRRDPFARTKLVRALEPARAGGCGWCGNFRASRRDAPAGERPHAPMLFVYGTARANHPTVDWHSGQFCCIECHDNCHT